MDENNHSAPSTSSDLTEEEARILKEMSIDDLNKKRHEEFARAKYYIKNCSFIEN